jgi:hypothetical protein
MRPAFQTQEHFKEEPNTYETTTGDNSKELSHQTPAAEIRFETGCLFSATLCLQARK